VYLLFNRQADVAVQAGVFQLTLPVNSIITITSLRNLGMHGAHPAPPEPQPFPFPYQENFDGESQSIIPPPADCSRSSSIAVVVQVIRRETAELRGILRI
jgi:hypothetical protein